MSDKPVTRKLPGYVTFLAEVDVPTWAYTAHPNEIRAMMANDYPELCWRGLGASIPWHDLLRFAEERVAKESISERL